MARSANRAPGMRRRGIKGKHAPERWQQLKPLICRLHYEDKTLSEIKAFLLSFHGFTASNKMYKARFRAWGLRKNITVPLLRKLLRYRVVSYGQKRRTSFYRRDRLIDVEAELRRRNVPVYDFDDTGGPLELPNLPATVAAVHPEDLSLAQTFSPRGIVAEKGKIMWMLHKVALHSHMYDQQLVDAWSLTRGRAGTGFVNRLKDCGRYFGSDLGAFMFDAAIDELVAQLRHPTRLGTLHTLRLVFGGSRWRDFGVTAMIWRMMVTQTSERLPPGHPLLCICEALYELLGQIGHPAFLELLAACAEGAVKDIEKVYGPDHPYVLEAWLYVVRYCGVGPDKLQRLLPIVLMKLQEVARGSSQEVALKEYLYDLATALKYPSELCELYVDSLLGAVQARAGRTDKEQRQEGVTLALAHYRVWDLKKSCHDEGQRATEPRRHLELAIEYLSGALGIPWTAGRKSIARVISWMVVLENWLRELGDMSGAETVGKRRREIRAMNAMGKQEAFIPLDSAHFGLHLAGHRRV